MASKRSCLQDICNDPINPCVLCMAQGQARSGSVLTLIFSFESVTVAVSNNQNSGNGIACELKNQVSIVGFR